MSCAVALCSWSRWAYALGQRYANATNEFEVWNEPSMSLDNADLYAELCVETCVALYDAFSGHDQTPLIYIGALSGGYSTSGIPFIAKTFAKMTELLTTHSNNIMETTLNQQKNSHQLTLADCVGGVSSHISVLDLIKRFWRTTWDGTSHRVCANWHERIISILQFRS